MIKAHILTFWAGGVDSRRGGICARHGAAPSAGRGGHRRGVVGCGAPTGRVLPVPILRPGPDQPGGVFPDWQPADEKGDEAQLLPPLRNGETAQLVRTRPQKTRTIRNEF